MIVLFAVFVLPAVGWTGVFSGGLTDDNRFTVETNALVPRLSLAFPFLMCVLIDRLSRSELEVKRLLVFLLASFYLMSVMGARFGFFQVLVTGFMFLLFSGNLRLLRKYRTIVVGFFALLVAVQLLLPSLRAGNDVEVKSDNFASAATFLGSVAGEHKDAAASLMLLSRSDREAIADNYVPSLIFPLVPGPFLTLMGFDKDAALTGGAAYFMQKAYSVNGAATIRVGGIAEAFFFLGNIGVALAAFLNALIALGIDHVVYKPRDKTFRAVSFAAYGSVWLFYFVVSQSNMLLGGFAAFVVTYFFIWYLGANRRATQAIGTAP
jgi:hypothetical protein